MDLEKRTYGAFAGAVFFGTIGAAVGWPIGAGVGIVAGGLFGYWATGKKSTPNKDAFERWLDSRLDEKLGAAEPGLSAEELIRLRTQTLAP